MKLLSQSGVTLIELVIVLMIIGILTTLSWEGQKALLRQYQLLGISRTLVSDIRAVQHQAVTSRQKCWIDLDADHGGYSVWMAVSNDVGRLFRQVRFPASVRFGSAAGIKGPPSNPAEITEQDGITFRDNRVVFIPNGGLATGGGAIYLTDDPAGKGTKAITVTVLGHARLYSWIGGEWR